MPVTQHTCFTPGMDSIRLISERVFRSVTIPSEQTSPEDIYTELSS